MRVTEEARTVEFIPAGEAARVLDDHGLFSESTDEDHTYVRMRDGETVRHHHLMLEGCSVDPREGAEVINIPANQLSKVIDGVLHKLHHTQILLIPVGKWRSIFDVVAFSLASNDEWQAVDAAATVELNTRDPLLADAGDLHLLCDLAKALLHDSDKPDQGLMLISVGQPVILEIIPEAGVRLSFGNGAIAAELSEVYVS